MPRCLEVWTNVFYGGYSQIGIHKVAIKFCKLQSAVLVLVNKWVKIYIYCVIVTPIKITMEGTCMEMCAPLKY